MTFRIYTHAEIKSIAINQLREFAKQIGVRGPTTMTKETLENAVYERLQEIEAERSVPSELRTLKSKACVLDKSLVEAKDKDIYGPFVDKPDAKLYDFAGWFRPYKDEDGIVCPRLTPHGDDIFVSEDFICAAQLKFGDKVTGKYAVSAATGVRITAEILTVNGKKLNEHRAADINERRRLVPSEPLNLWGDRNNLRALALAAPLKKGSRVLLSHDGLTSLTDYSVRLSECLKECGYETLSLYLDATPENAEILREKEGAFACAFDLGDEFVAYTMEMAVEAIQRKAEENAHIAVVVDNIDACKDSELSRRLLGCACSIDGGSVTVFASVNEDIMDRRSLGLLTSVADAKIYFENDGGTPAVDFKRSRVKTDRSDYPLLRALQSMDGQTAQFIISNCTTREEAEKLLK
jgi:transcription termination factor Rho